MTTTNFLGIPVEGDITDGRGKRLEQRPVEEFAPLVQALLDDGGITAFGWRQYTPYFNDGDPCYFSAHGVWVQTDLDEPLDPDEPWDNERLYASYHDTLGTRPRRYDAVGKVERGPYEGPNEARYDACVALEEAIECGAFDIVLEDAFGDHAEITVRRDAITVQFFDHE